MLFRTSTIRLQRDSSSRFLPWIIALMVFMGALALAAAMMVDAAVERWDRGLRGSLSVQIPPGPSESASDAAVTRVVEILEATPGVEAADALSREQVAELLEPWLGDVSQIGDLPIPRMIDVRVRADSAIAVAALEGRLREVQEGISVDDHQAWLDRLIAYASAMQMVALAVVAVIGAVSILTITFTTLTRMSIHRSVIDLLHLMGATDRFVAWQFQSHALRLGIGGGILGLVPTVACLWGLQEASADLEELLIPIPTLTPAQWAVLAALPLLTGVVAMLTARYTVLYRLARMP